MRGHRVERSLGAFELLGERRGTRGRFGRGGLQRIALDDVFVHDRFESGDLGQRVVETAAGVVSGARDLGDVRLQRADVHSGLVELVADGVMGGGLLGESRFETGDLGAGILESGERVVAILGPFGDLGGEGLLEASRLGGRRLQPGERLVALRRVRRQRRLEARDLVAGVFELGDRAGPLRRLGLDFAFEVPDRGPRLVESGHGRDMRGLLGRDELVEAGELAVGPRRDAA